MCSCIRLCTPFDFRTALLSDFTSGVGNWKRALLLIHNHSSQVRYYLAYRCWVRLCLLSGVEVKCLPLHKKDKMVGTMLSLIFELIVSD